MCIRPNTVYRDGPLGPVPMDVPCRKCWACLQNRTNELVGKSLCELAASDWALALTLTYSDRKILSDLQKKAIHKRDFQVFMMNMRRIYKCCYLCAGEYGERKGRAHFHVVLFGLGMPPEIALRTRCHVDQWPWGHVFVDAVNVNTIRYVAKYVSKARGPKRDQDRSNSEEWITYSRLPPLGTEYVLRLADQYLAERVFPRSFRINPPGGRLNDRYQISGVQQMMFLDWIFAFWPEAEAMPKAQWMENATVRWRKWATRRAFEALPKRDQARAYAQLFNPGFMSSILTDRDLTPYQRVRRDLVAQTNRELRQWLDAQRDVSVTDRKLP